MKILIPFLILLIPTTAVYGQGFDFCDFANNSTPEFSIGDGCTPDYYYQFSVTSNNTYKVLQIWYEENAYGDKQRLSYEVPAWVQNVDNWMNQGLISYNTHQTALEWVVNNIERD